MLGRIAAFLRIPQEVRPAYWEETLARNQVSLLIISIMIFGMELFNIVNVLFLSSSGLGTRNNRIYFSLYCALLLAAALALALQRAVRRRSRGVRWAVQYGATLFFLLWHVCVNAYDLYRSPDGEVGIYVTEAAMEGPAYNSGLQNGDVITSMDGQEVLTVKTMQSFLEGKEPGDVITVQVQRAGRDGYTPVELLVTLGTR